MGPARNAAHSTCTCAPCAQSSAGSAAVVGTDTLHLPCFVACRFIDDGGHPDDFVRNTFRAAVGDNQVGCQARDH